MATLTLDAAATVAVDEASGSTAAVSESFILSASETALAAAVAAVAVCAGDGAGGGVDGVARAFVVTDFGLCVDAIGSAMEPPRDWLSSLSLNANARSKNLSNVGFSFAFWAGRA
eukprot:SAG31_NODE_162_length_21892_cov_343.171936_10_plen_115_part_00